MRVLSLILLLAASALSAPQGQTQEVKEVKEAVKDVTELPEARHALHDASYTPLTPQFGAKLAPLYYQGQPQYYHGQPQYYHGQPQYYHGQPQYYQGQPQYYHEKPQYYQGQPQYYQGKQQFYQGHPQAYYQGAPAQTIISAKPHYHSGAYYSGSPSHFAHTPIATPVATTLVKKVVKPIVHYETERFNAPAFVNVATPAVAAPAVAASPIIKSAAAGSVAHSFQPEPFHAIVKHSHDDNFDGSFAYSYETDHGVAVESSGYLKNAGTDNQIQVMQGSYTYYTPEGLPITTTYIADENGFQVQGDHLPVPPEMPEAIAKSLAYQRSLPPSEEELVEEQRAKLAAKL